MIYPTIVCKKTNREPMSFCTNKHRFTMLHEKHICKASLSDPNSPKWYLYNIPCNNKHLLYIFVTQIKSNNRYIIQGN